MKAACSRFTRWSPQGLKHWIRQPPTATRAIPRPQTITISSVVAIDNIRGDNPRTEPAEYAKRDDANDMGELITSREWRV